MQMTCIMLLPRIVRFTVRMTAWRIILMFAPLAAAAGDLLNERLTASPEAREAHWKVDCSSTLAALQGAPADKAALVDALTKCRFIHQPPGATGATDCPDYEAILSAYTSNDIGTLQQALRDSRLCPGAAAESDLQHE